MPVYRVEIIRSGPDFRDHTSVARIGRVRRAADSAARPQGISV